MKFLAFRSSAGRVGLAVETEEGVFHGVYEDEAVYPGDLLSLLRAGPPTLADAAQDLANGADIDLSSVTFLPPIGNPGKIICVGLNYRDHAKEAGLQIPKHPTIFSRFSSSLIGHNAPIIKPRQSDELDFEAELVVVIGRRGKLIAKEDALDYIAGYSLFNDTSIRDYQFRTSQWTAGKNFDSTGAFGPYLVTADDFPKGGRGLRLQTRLNGETVQDGSTDDMIFNVETLVSDLSDIFTLEPGDIIITGTPAGVGMGRTPKLYMKNGDVCGISMEGIGVLCNPIIVDH